MSEHSNSVSETSPGRSGEGGASDAPVSWGGELRALWRLTLPLAAVGLGNQLKSAVDVAVVGRLGDVELAGVSLANIFIFVVIVFASGTIMGFDPMMSQALGAGRQIRARVLLWQSVWLALALAVVLTGVVLALPLAFVPLGIEAPVAAVASEYTWVRALGLIPALVFYGQRAYLQALGRTRGLVAAMIVSNAFNLVATIGLVFGGSSLPEWTGPLRALPEMGAVGSAWATVGSTVLQVVILVFGVPRLPQRRPRQWSRLPERAALWKCLRVGTPVGFQYAAEVGIFALVGLMAGQLGSVELASHQVALTLSSLTFMVSMSISSAGSVRVGRAVGAGDAGRVRVAGAAALASGMAFMSFGAVLFISAPWALIRTMTNDAQVIALAVPLLGVAAVFQLSDGVQAVAAGVLRGAGDTRFAFIANVLGHYAVGLPIALGLGFGAQMGVEGLWWGLCAGLTVVAVGLVARFWRLSGRPVKPI